MRAGWTFFRLELKRYGKAVPAVLLESLLFAFLILAFGIFATKYVYGDPVIGKIRVGVVSMEDEKLSGMLVNFVGSMDSMEESCSFELMDEAEAYRELEDGSIYAAIILPEGMLDGIMNGRNIPARVLFSTAYSRMETEVFKELASAGSRLLTAAQAGIYAADELCLELKHQEWIQSTEEYLNKAYLDYALARNSVFKLEEVNAVGKYSLIQYYEAALFLVFLSFAGLIMGRYAKGAGESLKGIMAAGGCGRGLQFAADAAAFSTVFSVLGMAVMIPLLLIMKPGTGFEMTVVLRLLLIFLSMGFFIRILIGIIGNETAGIGISFLILMILMAASGLFLPQAFLPAFMEKAGRYFPYRLWLKAILEMVC